MRGTMTIQEKNPQQYYTQLISIAGIRLPSSGRLPLEVFSVKFLSCGFSYWNCSLLFNQISSTKPESVGSILALNHNFFIFYKITKVHVRPKGAPFGFFSALCDFFWKFSNFIKGYPLHFLKFSVCKKRLMSLNDLFLGFSALCDFFYQILLKKKISRWFQ